MSWGYVAVGAATLISGFMSSRAQRKAGSEMEDAQVGAAQLGIEEQRRQFDQIMELISPYVAGGTAAFDQQGQLIGLAGAPAQQQAIQAIQKGPEFQALTRQGENAILQNASATGGLRGGNAQRALSEFRPRLLSELINQQFGRLGGLSGQGLAAATGLSKFGQETSNNITGLLASIGSAQAGGAKAQGDASKESAGVLGSVLGGLGGLF